MRIGIMAGATPGASAFDGLIAHPRILPFLREFMEAPQLVNTWSISKRQGNVGGGFHAGARPHEFAVDVSGKIHSKSSMSYGC